MNVRMLATLALVGVGLWSGCAMAQAVPSGSSPEIAGVGGDVAATSSQVRPACRVIDVLPAKAPVGGAGSLFAVCGSHGAPLGSAASYRAIVNPLSGSVLVVRVSAGRTRLLLASPVANGVHVDDVTREVSRLGGRAGDLGLGDLSVDVTRFAVGGSIAITNKRGEAKAFDLTSYATRAASAAVATTP